MARPEMPSKTPLGERLREVRRRFGRSRDEIAAKLKVAQNTIARYERGEMEPSTDVLLRYLETYDVNLHWLLSGQGKMLIGDETRVEDMTLAEVRFGIYQIGYFLAGKIPKRIKPEELGTELRELFDYLVEKDLLRDDDASKNVVDFSGDQMKRRSEAG